MENHDDVPRLWATRRLVRRCEEYLSLVDGVQCIEIEGPKGFRELEREIAACFQIGLQTPVSAAEINKQTDHTVRTFCFAAVQL